MLMFIIITDTDIRSEESVETTLKINMQIEDSNNLKNLPIMLIGKCRPEGTFKFKPVLNNLFTGLFGRNPKLFKTSQTPR